MNFYDREILDHLDTEEELSRYLREKMRSPKEYKLASVVLILMGIGMIWIKVIEVTILSLIFIILGVALYIIADK